MLPGKIRPPFTLSVLLFALLVLVSSSLYAQGDFQRAVSLYKQNQYREAAAEFRKLVEEDPLYETGYRVLGDCYLKLKQYSDASDAFEKAAELDPDNFASAQGLAMARYNMKDYEGAISALSSSESLAKSPPQKYQLHHIRGSSYYQTGRFQEAVRELTAANRIQRGNFSNILQLGISHFRLGNLDQARTFLDQALSIRPNSQEAREFMGLVDFRLGSDALKSGNYAEAARLFTSSVTLNPDDSEAWFNLGLAYLFSDNLMKAEEAFLKTVSLRPDQWQPYDRLGYIFETTGRYEEALENYEKALQLNDDPKIEESVDRVNERIRRRDAE